MRDCPTTQAYIARRTAEGKPSARANAASSETSRASSTAPSPPPSHPPPTTRLSLDIYMRQRVRGGRLKPLVRPHCRILEPDRRGRSPARELGDCSKSPHFSRVLMAVPNKSRECDRSGHPLRSRAHGRCSAGPGADLGGRSCTGGSAYDDARCWLAPPVLLRRRGGPPYQSRHRTVASSRRLPLVVRMTAAPRA